MPRVLAANLVCIKLEKTDFTYTKKNVLIVQQEVRTKRTLII